MLGKDKSKAGASDNGYDDIIEKSIDSLNQKSDFEGTEIDNKDQGAQRKLIDFSNPFILGVTVLAFMSVAFSLWVGRNEKKLQEERVAKQQELEKYISDLQVNEDVSDNSAEKRAKYAETFEELNDLADALESNLDKEEARDILGPLREKFRGLNVDSKVIENLEASVENHSHKQEEE